MTLAGDRFQGFLALNYVFSTESLLARVQDRVWERCIGGLGGFGRGWGDLLARINYFCWSMVLDIDILLDLESLKVLLIFAWDFNGNVESEKWEWVKFKGYTKVW